MPSNSKDNGAPPSSVIDAVLVKSNEMPEGSQKVEELDFNKFAGRPITVDDLISGMNHMGFQASSIGQAVKIINDMVSNALLLPLRFTDQHSEHGATPKPMTKPPSF
jgi:deoxyhypusine synthase